MQIAAALSFPALASAAARRFKPLEWVGPVGLCYLFGLLLANLPSVRLDRDVSLRIAELAVPLSIPLMLFGTRLGEWWRLARAMVLAFTLACISAVASGALHGWLFGGLVGEAWKVAGMLVGVYVGGTANASAIGLALSVKEETFVLLNASDMVTGGIYLLFLLTGAKTVLRRVLPPFPAAPMQGEGPDATRRPGVTRFAWAEAALASVAIVVASLAASHLFFSELVVPLVLLLVTTLGLAGSFMRRLRTNATSYPMGEYLLLAFCVAIGSLADVRALGSASPELFAMVAAVQLTAIALHYVLCFAFRVDADTALIASTATIFGPAFVGPVARAVGNRQLVAGGITAGLMGRSVANYLGLATAYRLRP